jgi:hypothetical protein
LRGEGDVIRVYTARTLADVANVKNVLEANGVPCILRNEFVGAGVGELPPIECWPEVWVDDADAEVASELLTHAAEEPDRDRKPWRCRTCRERVDAVFARCWSCGTRR